MNTDKIFRNCSKMQKIGIDLNTCILDTEGPKEPKLKSND